MYSLEFEIKDLPKTTNSKRSFGHWSQYHRETQKWKRQLVPYLQSKRPSAALRKARIVLIRKSSMEPDFDGLVSSFKHVLDSLVDARIIIDDRPSVIQPEYRWEKATKGKGSISIRVEELD